MYLRYEATHHASDGSLKCMKFYYVAPPGEPPCVSLIDERANYAMMPANVNERARETHEQNKRGGGYNSGSTHCVEVKKYSVKEFECE